MSGISFKDLLKSELRKRAWLILIIFGMCIITYPIVYQATFKALSNSDGLYMMNLNRPITDANGVSEFVLGWRNKAIYYIVSLSAIISAMYGFIYLHIKETVIPHTLVGVSKKKRFATRWIGGLLSGLIPVFVSSMISIFLIAPANKAFSTEMLGTAFSTMGLILLGYCSIYSICVLAMSVSTRIAPAILLIGTFLGFGPLCTVLMRISVLPHFFGNIYFMESNVATSPFMYLSPATVVRILAENPTNPAAWIAIFIFLYAGIRLGHIVYMKREEKYIDYPERPYMPSRMGVIIKIMWSVLVGLLSGEVFTAFSEVKATGLFVFGVLFGAFITNVAIEFIYEQDVTNIIRHRFSIAVSMGIAGAAMAVMFADPMGINTKIPPRENVRKMSVASADTSAQLRLLGGFVERDDNSVYSRDINWLLQNAFMDDIDFAYEGARDGAKYRIGQTKAYTEIYVGFELNDGKKTYRKYAIDLNESQEIVDNLSTFQNYRDKFYPTTQIVNNNYTKASLMAWNFASLGDSTLRKEVSLNENQRKILTECIKDDSLRFSASQYKNAIPRGVLTLYFEDSGFDEIYIYSGYKNTLSYLDELGLSDIMYRDFSVYMSDVERSIFEMEKTSNALSRSDESGTAKVDEIDNINSAEGIISGTYRVESKQYEFNKDETAQLLKCIAPARAGVNESGNSTYTVSLKTKDDEKGYYQVVVTNEEALGELTKNK